MDILILGGTVFLGRHLVHAALTRGHRITLFHRGQHNAGLFADEPMVDVLHGDRDGGLHSLRGRRWDAVIDTCGYVPRLVHDAATLLADQVEHYTFISTISVYPDPVRPGLTEADPVGILDEPTTETVTGATYGPLKALCEQAAEDAMPGRVLTIRPGLIVGPHDPSDRFTYWPVRVQRGGAILAPGNPDQEIQFVDVRDLAQWTIRMVEARTVGIFNATGPAEPLTMARFLAACAGVIWPPDNPPPGRFTWVDEAFLLGEDVGPYVDMPLWVPAADAGLEQVNCAKALAAGLTFRAQAETIRATLDWAAARSADHLWRAGLTPEREAQLLAKWSPSA